MGYYPRAKTTRWQTPSEFYDHLNNEFHFSFDPCPINWKEGDPDGLELQWDSSTFVNLPYDNVKKWIEKAYSESNKGKTVVLLVNACTDTQWFYDYVLNKAPEICFIRGRLKFIDPSDPQENAQRP